MRAAVTEVIFTLAHLRLLKAPQSVRTARELRVDIVGRVLGS